MNDLGEVINVLQKLEARIERLETSESQGDDTLRLTDGVTAPGTYTGYGLVYIDTADGDLKIKFGDGTTKTIVVDT